MKSTLRLGTRGSPLALIQAETVQKRLMAEHPDLTVEMIPIRTSGDWRPEHQERTFQSMGGNKGFFTKELEEALLAGFIDLAVHSMKDVLNTIPHSLTMGALCEREDPRDAFISNNYTSLNDMPKGAVIGTASLRRQAQILAARPDLRVVPLRGNVDTRLKKLDDGDVDAILLAAAGLIRLGKKDRITEYLSEQIMLPAVGQGALGLQIRGDDHTTASCVRPLNCLQTSATVAVERAFLRIVDGSCRTPIAGYAFFSGHDEISFEGRVLSLDGQELYTTTRRGPTKDAEKMGMEAGHELRAKAPAKLFEYAAP
jgi:hydroxymethylbilane synthase